MTEEALVRMAVAAMNVRTAKGFDTRGSIDIIPARSGSKRVSDASLKRDTFPRFCEASLTRSSVPMAVVVAAFEQHVLLIALGRDVGDQIENLLARQFVEQTFRHD